MTTVNEARAYYLLCALAESLGVPVSLDDPASPQTVAELERAVATCRCGAWPLAEYGPVCPSCVADGVER